MIFEITTLDLKQKSKHSMRNVQERDHKMCASMLDEDSLCVIDPISFE